MNTAKQNQKFPFHFFFRFAVEGWGEETREKCKEIFWLLHTRVRERVRGALVRFTTQSERTRQFQATTRSARAKLNRFAIGNRCELGTIQTLVVTCSELRIGSPATASQDRSTTARGGVAEFFSKKISVMWRG